MDNAPESVPHLAWLVNQGLAVALLLLFLWASWRGLAWCGVTLFVPIRDAAIKHLNDVGQSFESLAACLRELGAETKEINERTRRIEDSLGSGKHAPAQFQTGKSNLRGTEGFRPDAPGHGSSP